MKNNFLDIKVGDTVIVLDEYSHDYIEHILKVDSIEYHKDWITETNPKGMHCFGTDLEEEEWGDDYITQVNETNFVNFYKERENLWVCDHCLAGIQSTQGHQATIEHYVEGAESRCDWCGYRYDTLNEFI